VSTQAQGRILVLSGDGINCERETASAFIRAGGHADVIHVNEFLRNPDLLDEYSVLAFPGGFSFGDELRSGKLLAEKIRSRMVSVLQQFVGQGGLVIGICNGFQVLIQLGAFSGFSARHETLAVNDHGEFRDFWVRLTIEEGAIGSPWFAGFASGADWYLPVRHKEGRIVSDSSAPRIPLRYEEPINGAVLHAAALLDPSGRVLGLMPHPEAGLDSWLNPLDQPDARKIENSAQLLRLFQNGVRHQKGSNP
jgi:phosphoribosylformylglycinamidine (FGAM) synthase-like amidotransferase family enzyme